MALIDLSNSLLASSVAAWRGTAAFHAGAAPRPEQLLVLYEYEGSPYCRLVREVLSELDLDAMIYPCPRGGSRYRPEATALSGISQFPFLIDPNTGDEILESAEIIDHLYQHYSARGRRRAPRGVKRGLQLSGSVAATLLRSSIGKGGYKAKPSQLPAQPLELFSFESSPYSRPVRELLCELEIPYILRNFAKSRWQEMGPPSVRNQWFSDAPITSVNRIRLRDLTGRSQVPYLIDSNTGIGMFESQDIIRYLKETYAL
ncbi:Glutathione S-transferase, N-terminal domain [Spongiibacter sp. IMCC21906]|jgi:glutathione S-transferase|uniref:glutathione S-transferase N-terminal domain-containing protein n=1 Tax=Spongiibacter sp. IMCC21906 TaxID=1620392 RepID=UPI00062DEEE7|nr:glutathione S-transferase N-terminal domain-containing protein [Spongiibacter sp. IMCC21906]AKH68042.1 Glutathione S-transferase, N-terminal domain [Spongiibacter sp. IMCC21906]